MPLLNLNPCVPSGIKIDLCHILGANSPILQKSRKANYMIAALQTAAAQRLRGCIFFANTKQKVVIRTISKLDRDRHLGLYLKCLEEPGRAAELHAARPSSIVLRRALP